MHLFLGESVGRALCNFLKKFIILGPLLASHQSSHFGPGSALLHTRDPSFPGFVDLSHSVVDPEGFVFLLIGAPDDGRLSEY